jgi:hypothetical protein
MRIFSDFDVYSRNYTYDEMKIMSVLTQELDGTFVEDEFDYEDLCCVAEAIYAHWANTDERYQETVSVLSYLQVKGEEQGYVQAYVQRVWDSFVQFYLEKYKNYYN